MLTNIVPFWNESFKELDYVSEPFNDQISVASWLHAGYANKFTGAMCDMRKAQPVWNDKIIEYFAKLGWQDIGTCYYRMSPGTILPLHRDTYRRYIDIHNLDGKAHTIRRAIIFLEDWQSGHYLELNNEPIVNWKKGDIVMWEYAEPHLAANMGLTNRYTLQITGHIDDNFKQ